MGFDQVRALILANLHGLLRFGGREDRQGFWIWIAIVFVIVQAVMMVLIMPKFAALFSDMQTGLANGGLSGETGLQNGEAALPPASPQGPDNVLLNFHQAQQAIFTATIWSAGIFVILCAAAVSRRLHDAGRRGFWGLVPLPMLAFGLWQAITVIGEMRFERFPLLMAVNLAYLMSLAWLVFLLAKPGDPEPNRYGPPPVD